MNRSYILPGIAGLLMLGLIVLAGVHHADLLVLNPQGPIARSERWVIIITLLLSAIVVVPLFVLLAWFSYRYRASRSGPKGRHQPDWDHDNVVAEFSWWLAPTAIVIVLSFIMWRTSHELDTFLPLQSSEQAVRIQVVALQWKWLFIYPDLGIASVNEIEFPAGVPVHFDVTSDAPMNQFWIPSLGGQIMAMPGMSNQINLLADHAGTFEGLSSNISGEGFSGMRFAAKAVSKEEFATWVNTARAAQSPLTLGTYAKLAAPSSNTPVQYFSSVADGIYTASMMKYMGMKPGTDMQQGSAPQGMDMHMDMGTMPMPAATTTHTMNVHPI
jgi:cytochrome o ubiquinol oxidase subunit 2